jgi:Peptidase M66
MSAWFQYQQVVSRFTKGVISMNSRYPRLLAAILMALLPLLLSGTFLSPTRAQVLRANVPANTARTLPRQAPRASVAAQGGAPAAFFPSTMSEGFEGAWPAAGWSLQDYGTSGGEYLLGDRTCNPQSGSYAGWTGGGGADGSNLPCGANYANDVYSIAIYGPFDLTTASSSILTFGFSGASEQDYDTLYVAASIDDYYYCGGSYSGDYSASYFQGTLDLSRLECAGQPPSLIGHTNVTIAFFFISDYDITDIGFHIDDIVLTTVENEPPTATGTATDTPTDAPTDTPTDTPTGPTDTPTNTPTGPTNTPTDTPTDTPTNTPTNTPTPTNPPTSTPTDVPATTNLNLTVSRIDPNQAVQTASGSVPLIAGRPAIVRVTVNVQNGSEAVLGVSARLHGVRNGVELPNSPLSPFNNGGSIVAPLTPNGENFGHTLNFQLPTNWTTGGTLVLWAEVNPNRAVNEANYADNRSADLTLNFVAVPTLQIVLVPIAYQPNGAGPVMRPDLTQNNQGLTNLQNLYPIADVQTTLHSEYLFTGALNGGAGWGQLLDQLTAVRNRELGGAARTSKIAYYGVVPRAAVAGLSSFIAGMGWVGNNMLASVGLEHSFGVAAHEVGHNLGLDHAPCGVSGDANYPFADGRVGDVGIDPFQRQLHPSTDKDFMSYCDPIWVSAYHYNKMLRVLAPAAAAAQPAAVGDGLLISGSIYSDTVTAQLSASVPLSSTETVEPGGSGPYRVELRDTNGTVQYTYAFTPQALDSHIGAPDYGFSFVAPLIANLGRIQLWKDSTLIAEQVASNVQPNLTATYANATDTITVNWQASSPDATPVGVSLRYSSDNGLSWRMLALNLTGTSFTIDKRNLPGGSGGLLEVIAGNTTRTRTVQLTIGTIGNKPPVLSIAGTSSVQQYIGQPLLLQAVALDIEDGYLQGNSLIWSEGTQVLGAGETLTLPTGLTLGAHTLTLTATDSAGAQTQDTVRVTVVRPPPVSLQKTYSIFLPFTRR